MTEAREHIPPEYAGDARIKVHPGPELNQALERFMSLEHLRRLGGRAIDLVSEGRLGVFSRPIDEDLEWRRTGVSKAELVALSRNLKDRQRSIKPAISPHVYIDKYVPPKEHAEEGPGIDFRFRILIDQLTERVLANTVLLDPIDNGLYVHLSIRRPNLRLGRDLPDARDDLLELLRHSPQQVQSIYIDSDALHP